MEKNSNCQFKKIRIGDWVIKVNYYSRPATIKITGLVIGKIHCKMTSLVLVLFSLLFFDCSSL